jgi:hypothetical protein
MNKTVLRQKYEIEEQKISFQWDKNNAVKELLDVVVGILAEEYIQITKENPEIFSNNEIAASPAAPRNDILVTKNI